MNVILTVLLFSVSSVFANSPLQLRIINGYNARKGEFPHQVSLQFQANLNPFAPYEHHCGGSIISTNWVLTAAHCLVNSSIDLKIVAGINRLSDMHGQESKILQTIIHPEYNSDNNHNDIALLKLVRPFILNDFVQTIALPKSGTKPSGGYAVVSGWGSISYNTGISIPDFLQTAVLPLLPIDLCYSLFNTQETKNDLNVHTNLCTGPLSGGVGPCIGDSGGPLARDGVLLGIVSWTLAPCAGQNVPTVYTKVSSFIPFIRQYVNDLQ